MSIARQTGIPINRQNLSLYDRIIDESLSWEAYGKIYGGDQFILSENKIIPQEDEVIDEESSDSLDEEIYTEDVLEDPEILETMVKKWEK